MLTGSQLSLQPFSYPGAEILRQKMTSSCSEVVYMMFTIALVNYKTKCTGAGTKRKSDRSTTQEMDGIGEGGY